MKRNDINRKTEGKPYSINICELYEITALADFGKYAKGEKHYVSLPVAMKHCRNGVCAATEEIRNAAKKAGIPETYYTPKKIGK